MVKIAGVYFPATPTGNVKDCGEAVKNFLIPKLLTTPSDLIMFVTLNGVPSMALF